MATANEYADWIVNNQDKKGTEDFNTVVRAYEEAKAQESAAPAAAPAAASAAITQPGADMQTPATVQAMGTVMRPGVAAAETLSRGGVQDLYGIGKILYNNLTPAVMGDALMSPIEKLKGFGSAYAQGHPWANMSLSRAVPAAGQALVQGALAPENLFAIPYNMAAYEQSQIRANPTAPQYATNPYAQTVRGEYPTQAAAGAANRRMAVASQQYGGLTPQEQSVLDQDRLTMIMRLNAARRVLGQTQ